MNGGAQMSGATPECDTDIGMNIPSELKYTQDHEWAKVEGSLARIGITDYAQDALGDVVFVQLPEVGSSFEAGGTLGEVESTKSVSDIYAPISGVVVEVNSELSDSPELLNSDPYGRGWICALEPSDPASIDSMLDSTSYQKLIAG